MIGIGLAFQIVMDHLTRGVKYKDAEWKTVN